MERISLKLNDMSPLINLLIEKIQLLDSGILTRDQKLLHTKDMLEVVEDLKKFFAKISVFKNDEQKKNFMEGIERAFSLFEWNTRVYATPLGVSKVSENGKALLSSILKLLGMKGCGILIIETYVKLCLKIVNKMKEVENKNLHTDKTNFKLLLDGLSLTSVMLKKYWHIAFSSDQKTTVMLCLHQICKILPYLLKMIEIQNNDIKNYSLNLLAKCLTKFETEIHGDGNLKSNNQKFIEIMDFCLYKLNELLNYTNDFASFIKTANDNAAVLKPVIDEILCSVMSIAQVTNFEEDNSAIIDGSHKVLKELNEFDNAIKKENSCEIKLNASSLMESLCNIEQKVNIAVLKLVLEVFSSGNLPLKNILNKCRIDILKDNKALEDLNALILDFDSEMDKIMQIGFFAISCTTSLNRILQIQSCLASLESLETELISSLTALYVNSTAKNKTNFQCLFDFWLNEIAELKILIDSVLDPAGFCGVVKNQIYGLGLIFKETLPSSNLCLNNIKFNFKQAIKYSRKLIKTLKTSMKDETKINETTENFLRKLQLAVQEFEAVLEVIDKEQDTNKIISQAAKRFNFLMHIMDKLSSHLYLLNENESLFEQSNITNVLIPQKNYYKLCETADVTLVDRNGIPEILTPYLNTGILRSKKRNVMYTTPVKVDEYVKDFNRAELMNNYWEKTPVSSKRRSRCCKPLTQNLELENTIDLEISAILEKISCLSNDFSKTFNSTIEFQHREIEKGSKYCTDAASVREKDDTKATYTSSGCCTKSGEEDSNFSLSEKDNSEKKFLGYKLRNHFLQKLNDLSQTDSLLVENESEANVDSPDRMSDIKVVEERINFLKTTVPFVLP